MFLNFLNFQKVGSGHTDFTTVQQQIVSLSLFYEVILISNVVTDDGALGTSAQQAS